MPGGLWRYHTDYGAGPFCRGLLHPRRGGRFPVPILQIGGGADPPAKKHDFHTGKNGRHIEAVDSLSSYDLHGFFYTSQVVH